MGAERPRLSPRIPTLLALIAVTAAGCDVPAVTPSSSAPYDPRVVAQDTLGDVLELYYHWPLGHTVSIYVDTATQPAGTDLRVNVARGIALWKATVWFRELDARIVASPRDADVIIHHVTAPPPDSVTICASGGGPAGGITFFCADDALDTLLTLPLADGSGGHVKMDVTVDRAKVPTEERFQSLVTHELGHVFGIGQHSGDATDLMFGAPTAVGPTDRDAATMRFALHQRADLRP